MIASWDWPNAKAVHWTAASHMCSISGESRCQTVHAFRWWDFSDRGTGRGAWSLPQSNWDSQRRKYPTLGILLPLFIKMFFHTLAEAENDKRLTKSIKEAIRDDLTSWYQDDVVTKKLSIAMYWVRTWILDLKLCLFWMTQRGMMSCSVWSWNSLSLLMQTSNNKYQQNRSLVSQQWKEETHKIIWGHNHFAKWQSTTDISPWNRCHLTQKVRGKLLESLDSLESLKWWKAREQQKSTCHC